jgi:hypothetical protein
MDEVSPRLFMDAAFAYPKTAAIKAAIALGLFTALAAGADTADALAARTGDDRRGIAILCDYLTVQGFIEKTGDRYAPTPSSRTFLDAASPAYIGRALDFLAAPQMLSAFLDDPAGYVRRGGSEGLASVAPDHPLWVTFAEAMTGFARPVAAAVAARVAGWPRPPRRLLDIAAGHGLYGITLAQALPEAEVTGLDWPGVLAVARRNAAAAGVGERYRTIAGSAFDVDWGSGYDLVMLPNFLHHFDRDTCIGLLARAKRAHGAEGRTLVVEFVPNEDRVSPPMAASFAFVMLGNTPKGQTYTAGEFDEMARAAGFGGVTVAALDPTPQSLVLFEP